MVRSRGCPDAYLSYDLLRVHGKSELLQNRFVKESEIRNASIHNQYLELVRLDAQKYFDDDLYCENLNCPVCASHASKREFDKFGFSYVSCEDCLTLYVNPRPKLDRLEEFYISSESSRFWIEEFFKPVAEAAGKRFFAPGLKKSQKCLSMLVTQLLVTLVLDSGCF